MGPFYNWLLGLYTCIRYIKRGRNRCISYVVWRARTIFRGDCSRLSRPSPSYGFRHSSRSPNDVSYSPPRDNITHAHVYVYIFPDLVVAVRCLFAPTFPQMFVYRIRYRLLRYLVVCSIITRRRTTRSFFRLRLSNLFAADAEPSATS